jgi:hypothetical protein
LAGFYYEGGVAVTTNGVATRIARQASTTDLGETDWNGCFWAEQIPRFHRGETGSETNRGIREHLEGCEECNTLLMALAVQSPPKTGFAWIRQGVHQTLNRVVSLRDIVATSGEGMPAPQPAMRGAHDDYSLSGKRIPLPDGSELCINVVGIQSQKQILTAAMSDGTCRRYDLYTRSGSMLKSIDNAHQIKIAMPEDGVVLVVDDQFEINLGDGNE